MSRAAAPLTAPIAAPLLTATVSTPADINLLFDPQELELCEASCDDGDLQCSICNEMMLLACGVPQSCVKCTYPLCETCALKLSVKCPGCKAPNPDYANDEPTLHAIRHANVLRCKTCGVYTSLSESVVHIKSHFPEDTMEALAPKGTPFITRRALDVAGRVVRQFAPHAEVEALLRMAAQDVAPLGHRNAIILAGASGAGKSTLINELIGFDLLPVRAEVSVFSVTPMEVEVCNTGGGGRGDGTDEFTIDIRFLSSGSWLRWRGAAALACRGPKAGAHRLSSSEGPPPVDAAKEVLFRGRLAKVMRAVTVTPFSRDDGFQGHSDPFDELSVSEMESAQRGDQVTDFLNHVAATVPESTVRQRLKLSDARRHLAGCFDDGWQMLIQRIRVEGPLGAMLPVGVGLVDCPGGKDPDPWKRHRMREALRQASYVILVINAKRNMSAENAAILSDIREEHPALLTSGRVLVVAKGLLPREKEVSSATIISRWKAFHRDSLPALRSQLQRLLPQETESEAMPIVPVENASPPGTPARKLFEKSLSDIKAFLARCLEGQTVCLTGVTGAGKSTLINDLLGMRLMPVRHSLQLDPTTPMEIALQSKVLTHPTGVPAASARVTFHLATLEEWISTRCRMAAEEKRTATQQRRPAAAANDSACPFSLTMVHEAVRSWSRVVDPTGALTATDPYRDALLDELQREAYRLDPISVWLKTTREIECNFSGCESTSGDETELDNVSGALASVHGALQAIVCRVTVTKDFSPTIPHGVALVDCPGHGDSVELRNLRMLRTIKEATRAIVVMNAQRNAGTETEPVFEMLFRTNPAVLHGHAMIIVKALVDADSEPPQTHQPPTATGERRSRRPAAAEPSRSDCAPDDGRAGRDAAVRRTGAAGSLGYAVHEARLRHLLPQFLSKAGLDATTECCIVESALAKEADPKLQHAWMTGLNVIKGFCERYLRESTAASIVALDKLDAALVKLVPTAAPAPHHEEQWSNVERMRRTTRFSYPTECDFRGKLENESDCQCHHMACRAFANKCGEHSGAQGDSKLYTRTLYDFFRRSIETGIAAFRAELLSDRIAAALDADSRAQLANETEERLMTAARKAANDTMLRMFERAPGAFNVPHDIYFQRDNWLTAVGSNLTRQWNQYRAAEEAAMMATMQPAVTYVLDACVTLLSASPQPPASAMTAALVIGGGGGAAAPSPPALPAAFGQRLALRHLHRVRCFLRKGSPYESQLSVPTSLTGDCSGTAVGTGFWSLNSDATHVTKSANRRTVVVVNRRVVAAVDALCFQFSDDDSKWQQLGEAIMAVEMKAAADPTHRGWLCLSCDDDRLLTHELGSPASGQREHDEVAYHLTCPNTVVWTAEEGDEVHTLAAVFATAADAKTIIHAWLGTSAPTTVA